ncbi:hypothetical protein JHK86_036774 [Glycine max]|nr:hypothetical protein JHK86_036774 [Glycine max]
MSMVDLEGKEGYRPSTEYVEDSNETLINLTDSTELLFLKLPSSNDFLSDIHGQKLFLTLHNDGKLASFKDSSGKVYDFVSYSAQEPDETVFVSSTEPKIVMVSQGKCRGGEGERSLGEKVAGGGRQTTTVGGRRWVPRINREDYGSWTESNMKGESKQREGRNHVFSIHACTTKPLIRGKISRRVSTVHYSDPKELEKLNSTNAKHAHGNSSGVTGTTSSRYFPMQSSGAASSKGSRQRSSLTEASEPSSISKRRHASKSKSNLSEASHGHSTGISSMSPDHSHEGKAKRRKHKE